MDFRHPVWIFWFERNTCVYDSFGSNHGTHVLMKHMCAMAHLSQTKRMNAALARMSNTTHESLMSHEKPHATHEWVMPYTNESYHQWMSHVTRTNKSCPKWAIPHMNSSCYTCMNQAKRTSAALAKMSSTTRESGMSQMHETCMGWLRLVGSLKL